jgi:hypothetical protein
VACFPAILHEQTPSEEHVFTDLQNALLEQRANVIGEPVRQFGALGGVRDQLDPETDLGKRDRGDIQEIERLPRDECDDFAMWFRSAELLTAVGSERDAVSNGRIRRHASGVHDSVVVLKRVR